MMPSNSVTPSSAPGLVHKRNLKYACDRCRRKKIKCDTLIDGGSELMKTTGSTVGPRLDVQISCSHCATANEQCTYGMTVAPKAIPKKYVTKLKNQWDSLTWLIPQVFSPTYLMGNPEFLKGTEVSNTLSTPRDPRVWPLLVFPPEDLYQKLVNLYFSHINILWPLFHHPTFQADLVKERHKYDLGFAQVLLGICAVASRYSSDPRVLAKVPQEYQAELTAPERMRAVWIDDLEGTRVDVDERSLENAPRDSAGWKYYNRICDYHTATTTEITLTELQTAHLIYQFLLGMPDRKAGSVILGAALRRVQARGLHHRNKNMPINLENELWKRAYWCLVVAERMMALETTQTLLSLDENIEVDLPLELDDETWALLDMNGKINTPRVPDPDKPSLLTVFNHYARFSSEFEKLIKNYKRPFEGEEITEVFIQPYREWLEKTPQYWGLTMEFPVHAGSDFHANPIWEAQSNFFSMAYGFFGVSMCAISMNGMDRSFIDEVLELILETLASVNTARLTDKKTCRLCSNEHSSVYVNDVPSLICLATVTAIFVAHLRAKWRNAYRVKSNSPREESYTEGENSKEAFYNNIVTTCWNILETLREGWMTARKSLTLIEDFINSTGTEEMSPWMESSGSDE